MTTLTKSNASIPSPPAQPPPATEPITPLNTPLAQAYTLIHPFILLTIFVARFKATVADPISSLSSLLLVTAVLQGVYAVLCLPATGAGSRSKDVSKDKKWVKPKRGSADDKAGGVWPYILSLVLTPLPALPILVLTILMGAPITTHISHTVLLALHLALLAATPLIYAHGIGGETWRQLCALLVPVDEVLGGSIGALGGAWVGCVPIPLDWDREWQAYPITIVTGAYIGYAIGKLLGGTVFRGKHMSFD